MLIWLIGILTLGVVLAGLFPATSVGGWCHRVLVDNPARWLSRGGPRRLFVALLVTVALVLVAVAAPEFLPFAGDLALFVDLAVLTAATAARNQWSRAVSAARAGLRQGWKRLAQGRPRARSGSKPRVKAKRPANDDAEPWGLEDFRIVESLPMAA